jgi:hypothetical protein
MKTALTDIQAEETKSTKALTSLKEYTAKLRKKYQNEDLTRFDILSVLMFNLKKNSELIKLIRISIRKLSKFEKFAQVIPNEESDTPKRVESKVKQKTSGMFDLFKLKSNSFKDLDSILLKIMLFTATLTAFKAKDVVDYNKPHYQHPEQPEKPGNSEQLVHQENPAESSGESPMSPATPKAETDGSKEEIQTAKTLGESASKEGDSLEKVISGFTGSSQFSIASYFFGKRDIRSKVKQVIDNKINSIVGIFNGYLGKMSSWYDKIKRFAKDNLSALVNFFRKAFKKKTEDAPDEKSKSVSTIIKEKIDTIVETVAKSVSIFSAAKDKVVEAGKHAISGVISGIRSIFGGKSNGSSSTNNSSHDSNGAINANDNSQSGGGGVTARNASSGAINYHGYDALMVKAYSEEGFSSNDMLILKAQVFQESRYNMTVKSGAGAYGLTQFMPKTAVAYGCPTAGSPVNEDTAYKMLKAQAKYMKYLLRMFNGNWKLALAGYNAGEGRVKNAGNRVPDIQETQNYVRKIYQELAPQMSLDGKAPVSLISGNKSAKAAPVDSKAVSAPNSAPAQKSAQVSGANTPTPKSTSSGASNKPSPAPVSVKSGGSTIPSKSGKGKDSGLKAAQSPDVNINTPRNVNFGAAHAINHGVAPNKLLRQTRTKPSSSNTAQRSNVASNISASNSTASVSKPESVAPTTLDILLKADHNGDMGLIT